MAANEVTGNEVTEPAVRALIAAINAGDREAFFAALTPDATMSDDGTDRDLADWAEREIFTVHGRLDVVSARDGGRSLIAAYRNDTWGEMRTRWAFTIADGKISRFETGQA
jgi:ketosteroid isomerase-like protein